MFHTLPSMGFRIFTYVHPIQNTSLPSTQRHPKFGSYPSSHHQAPLRGHAQAPISVQNVGLSQFSQIYNMSSCNFCKNPGEGFNDHGKIWEWMIPEGPLFDRRKRSVRRIGIPTAVRQSLREVRRYTISCTQTSLSDFLNFSQPKNLRSELCQDACVCVFLVGWRSIQDHIWASIKIPSSWWFQPTHLEKYDRQNGFIFPKFRGEKIKIFQLPPPRPIFTQHKNEKVGPFTGRTVTWQDGSQQEVGGSGFCSRRWHHGRHWNPYHL